MITYFEYPHTVSEQEIDDLDHAGNFHYIKWMQHAAIACVRENVDSHDFHDFSNRIYS